jgi:hypothetical protein
MEKFAWSFDGIKFSDAEPLRLKYGERLRITLVNDTMMTHPIHLHGMWSDLEDENGNFMVRKHTIDMPPGSKRSYRVTADALGVGPITATYCSIWKWACSEKSVWTNELEIRDEQTNETKRLFPLCCDGWLLLFMPRRRGPATTMISISQSRRCGEIERLEEQARPGHEP